MIMAAFLCKQQMQVFLYLDDWPIKAKSQAQVAEHVSLAHATFLRLALILNMPQSTLIPMQSIEFIGAFLESTQAKVFLP